MQRAFAGQHLGRCEVQAKLLMLADQLIDDDGRHGASLRCPVFSVSFLALLYRFVNPTDRTDRMTVKPGVQATFLHKSIHSIEFPNVAQRRHDFSAQVLQQACATVSQPEKAQNHGLRFDACINQPLGHGVFCAW
jgi:hypothetical protein